MISWRTIISESAGPIFAIFSPNERVLGAYEMNDLDLFFDISRDVAMAIDFMQKNGKLPIFVAFAFRNGMGYR